MSPIEHGDTGSIPMQSIGTQSDSPQVSVSCIEFELPNVPPQLSTILIEPTLLLRRQFEKNPQESSQDASWKMNMLNVKYAITHTNGQLLMTLVHRGNQEMQADFLDTHGNRLATLDLGNGGSQGNIRVLLQAGHDASADLRVVSQICPDLEAFRSKYDMYCADPSGKMEWFGKLTEKPAKSSSDVTDAQKTCLGSIHNATFLRHSDRIWESHRFKIQFKTQNVYQRLTTLVLAFILDCEYILRAKLDVTYS
ncbi:hypothetical protein MYAM1_000042 [Malassezia yamatoensis]|uniref:Uncharacterized protein n=1 Tax=Malassezia yamatoensis TaxID=253288 RepID=A0AAJ6CEK6_9BASI|nr:hypothetical protein MYAM1_000042 [Malassezia yamatoensis]